MEGVRHVRIVVHCEFYLSNEEFLLAETLKLCKGVLVFHSKRDRVNISSSFFFLIKLIPLVLH